MIKLLLIMLCIILCLLACNHPEEEAAETASPPIAATVNEEPERIIYVEWTDFVKYGGQTYEGDWGETTVPLENIGKLLGYIENSVPSVIYTEDYTVPDNASPSREIGSPFYAVADNENAIAVYDSRKNTYYLYKLDE